MYSATARTAQVFWFTLASTTKSSKLNVEGETFRRRQPEYLGPQCEGEVRPPSCSVHHIWFVLDSVLLLPKIRKKRRNERNVSAASKSGDDNKNTDNNSNDNNNKSISSMCTAFAHATTAKFITVGVT